MIKIKSLPHPLWNAPGRGGVQTAFTRFQKQPHGQLRSLFSDSADAFRASNPLVKREIETPYSDILGPLVLGGEEDDDKS